jgi:hypothetical protein
MENSIHAPTPRIFERDYITVWDFPGTIKVASWSTGQAGGQSNWRKGEQQSISLFIRLRDTGWTAQIKSFRRSRHRWRSGEKDSEGLISA